MDTLRRPYGFAGAPAADAARLDEGLRTYLLGVFNYMASGVLLSAIVGWLISATPALQALILGTPLKWVAMFAPLGLALLIGFRHDRLSKTAILGMFWAMAACYGVAFGTILMVFTGESVLRAFLAASAAFAGAALLGYTTKRDLSGFGTFLFMGMIGILVAGLLNLVIGSSMVGFVVSVLAVLVFTGLTAWDMQRLKSEYLAGYGSAEFEGKASVMGALGLYINFMAIFMNLAQLLGVARGEE
jgi:FtsH-binding integral membrane protein